ncbi:MAG: YceG family protein [Oscillospiraceae bacterium]|nr:YceG family protein [Oscillospiraceae bacterium]
MLAHQKITNSDDFFQNLSQRSPKGVYFCRINGWNPEVNALIRKYYDAARRTGVVIEGGIPNPTNQNLAYYQEMMGSQFQMNETFIQLSLRKWLPRMNPGQCDAVTSSVYHTLDQLRQSGKPETVLKNIYIKFMCWLYYKFERILGQLGMEQIPKILYEGEISNHALLLISVLAHAGSDVIVLQYHGDQNYLKLDPRSEFSETLDLPGMTAFPQNFSLEQIRQELNQELNRRRLYGTLPEILNCTNAWLSGNDSVFAEIRKSPAQRGQDQDFFYNCYCRLSGVEEKQSYPNQLYRFYTDLKNAGRNVVILDHPPAQPDANEVSAIQRKNNYTRLEDMIQDLAMNLSCPANLQLQRLFVKSFVDVMLEESTKSDRNLNKLMNQGIYLICWLKRHQSVLFRNWKAPDIGCMIYLGGCQNEKEALFFRFLARLPVDVLILTPGQNQTCCLEDSLLYEQHFTDFLEIAKFPRDLSEIRIGTTAYHAERELDQILYQDSGIYRNQQYQKANSVTLRTTYEEIALYWREEVSMRPNFEIVDQTVTVPVLFAKISGVKDGDVHAYWDSVKMLMAESPYVIYRAPFVQMAGSNNPLKSRCINFLDHGKLQRDKIRRDKYYSYGFLREEIQEHMLDKLQLLLDQRMIRGIYETGTEYDVIATILHLDISLIREIQKFDFTKKNPKLMYILANEKVLSLEDSIIMAFLHLVGFDILFLVPTGYQSVEQHFQKLEIEQHQIGEYLYDLRPPDLRRYAGKPVKSNPFDKIFRKKK